MRRQRGALGSPCHAHEQQLLWLPAPAVHAHIDVLICELCARVLGEKFVLHLPLRAGKTKAEEGAGESRRDQPYRATSALAGLTMRVAKDNWTTALVANNFHFHSASPTPFLSLLSARFLHISLLISKAQITLVCLKYDGKERPPLE